ncbi:uncharacterized protein LOC128577066 [Nycticebus coucang]|uniref:uncharacterized protein LOC128577066 n=1 Tax=Nycticebus coucang TaxID=9470 RepID=UPI00234E2952|nr:uncharacterized protein LOC128577066 [Nycticebus coucang]
MGADPGRVGGWGPEGRGGPLGRSWYRRRPPPPQLPAHPQPRSQWPPANCTRLPLGAAAAQQDYPDPGSRGTTEQQGLSPCPAAAPGLPPPLRSQLPTLPARPDAATSPPSPLPRTPATGFLHSGGARAKEGKKIMAPESTATTPVITRAAAKPVQRVLISRRTCEPTQVRNPTTVTGMAVGGNSPGRMNRRGTTANTPGTAGSSARSATVHFLGQTTSPDTSRGTFKAPTVDMTRTARREFSILYLSHCLPEEEGRSPAGKRDNHGQVPN